MCEGPPHSVPHPAARHHYRHHRFLLPSSLMAPSSQICHHQDPPLFLISCRQAVMVTGRTSVKHPFPLPRSADLLVALCFQVSAPLSPPPAIVLLRIAKYQLSRCLFATNANTIPFFFWRYNQFCSFQVLSLRQSKEGMHKICMGYENA